MMGLALKSQLPASFYHTSYSQTFQNSIDCQPLLDMFALYTQTGRGNFHSKSIWEISLFALILKLDPKCKIESILEAFPYDDRPMDEADFLNTMAHLGYFCRKANLDVDTLDARLMPCMMIPHNAELGDEPRLIVGRDSENNLQYFHPHTKEINTTPPSYQGAFSLWFFQKYDENRARTSKFMRKGSESSWFVAMLSRFRGTFAQVMTAGFFLNFIALLTPLYIMLVYDRVVAAGSLETLPMLVVGAIIAITFEYKLRNIRSTGLSWLAGRLDNVVVNKIFSHLIGLAPHLIEKASVASQVARIKTFESVRDFFCGSVFLSLLDGPFVFMSIAAISLIGGTLVFVPVFISCFYIALFYVMRQKIKTSIRIAAKASSARQQYIIETFEKLDTIKGHGLEKRWQTKFRQLSGREMMSHFTLSWQGMIAETLAHKLTIIAAIATVGFGVHLIWAGSMTTGALIASMVLVWRILTPFYSVCTMIPRLEQIRNSIIQVNELMDIETEAEEAKSFSRLPTVKGAVSFHNVSLQYKGEFDYTFSDLNFEAKPGDLVAITGPNGSGKATVLKLVKSLHLPTTGSVRIDGFDIRQLDAPNLRRQIAYVPKKPEFFKGTILENMRFSNPLVSEVNVIKALKLADAWEEIKQLPKELETIIGAGGEESLTSSMATKLSLARAYLNQSSILLIDELPNTLLIGKAGQNLKDYLVRAKGKKTVLFCTYREDFMRLADTIVYLRKSKQPIVGRRDDVLDKIAQFSTGDLVA